MAGKLEVQDLIEVLESPDKSYSDSKNYRLIRIKENGIRALLVSHGGTDKKPSQKSAAVGLTVNVGGTYDIRSGVYGMAHFTEHMIFMGSKKYPQENDFQKFISAHGGLNLAMTMNDQTLFNFSVNEDHLEEAVNRFSDLFKNPLMRKESMNRERDAVNSEFRTKQNGFRVRMELLMNAFGAPGHPSSCFVCGNSKTLKEDVTDDELYEKVHDFRKKYYVSQLMTLAIQSELSLDELESLVVKYFSDIPKASELQTLISEMPEFSYENAFTSNFHKKMHYIDPKGGSNSIVISWCLPSMIDHYRTAPKVFLDHVLGHDGPGSLVSYLKKNFLCESFDVMQRASLSVYSLVHLVINLTEHGAQNIEKILEAIFSYLLLVQKSGTDEKFLKGLQKRCAIDFRFVKEDSPFNNAREMSYSTLTCVPKDILTNTETISEIDAEYLQSLIDIINEGKFNLTHVTSNYKNFDKKHPLTGIEYAEVDFPEEYQKLWDNRKLNEEFKLPSENPYLPSNFDIVYNETLKDSMKPHPEKISENDVAEVWYRLDDTFLKPKVHVQLGFMSPYFTGSTYNCIVKNIYANMLQELMKEILNTIKKAGNSVNISEKDTNLSISIESYSDKIEEICQTVCKNFIDFTENFTDHKTFEVSKEKLKNSWNKNLKTVAGYYDELLNDLLNYNQPSEMEFLKVIDKISFEDIKHFASAWRKQAKVKVLIQGNILQENAVKMSNSMVDMLKLQRIDEDLIKMRTFQTPIGLNCRKEDSLMPNNSNSLTLFYYQIGRSDYKTQALTDLLHAILRDPFYEIMRTQQQLGYIVQVIVRKTNNYLGLELGVVHQEDKYTSKFVSGRVDEFIQKNIHEILTKMEQGAFENSRKTMIKKKLSPNESLQSEVSSNWTEIISEDYDFNAKTKQAEAIEKVTKDQLLEFYEVHFKSTNARKILIQVCGSNPDSKEENDGTDESGMIRDSVNFKNSMFVLPTFTANS